MERGEVWWARLPKPIASEPGFNRPVVIVQSDTFNRSVIRTAIAVVVTTNLRLADSPGNVLLPRDESSLSEDSVANVSQVITVDRTFLTKKCGRLPPHLMSAIDEGLRLVLSL